jgi:rhodanese-related sulfurtransferase
VAEHTSAGAALTLRSLGVKNVRPLLGGYGAWVDTYRTVVMGDKPK